MDTTKQANGPYMEMRAAQVAQQMVNSALSKTKKTPVENPFADRWVDIASLIAKENIDDSLGDFEIYQEGLEAHVFCHVFEGWEKGIVEIRFANDSTKCLRYLCRASTRGITATLLQ